MATYSKLLLSTGGGIISQIQQAEQVEQTATLLIGLGGTGIDCLTEMKKAVRERLKPDNPDALIPTYNHIRFLAVDTDVTSGITNFERDEVFDISNPSMKKALESKTTIAARKDLDWLDPEKVNVPSISFAGAGGFRQAGRYLLMDKSSQFLAKIEDMIRQAKSGLSGNASLYVHVFSGLGGGTGSGTFLDACYMIRKAMDNVNGGNGLILGYFFLPDVNLTKVSAALVQEFIKGNGYAAMQELDYCMGLPGNGGSFVQEYKNGIQIAWDHPPVNLCHLISATDRNFAVKPNAYNNALKVTVEYVMDFLTKPEEESSANDNTVGTVKQETGEGENKFTINSHLANCVAQVDAANQMVLHGYNLNYLIIGASCASIPMREINTYLATKVFTAFSGLDGASHTPTKEEVQKIAEKVGLTKGGMADIDSLLTQLTKDGGDSNLAVAPDYLGMEFTRDNGDKDLLYHYTNQKADKIGVIEQNAKSMVTAGNSDSLISRICHELNACAQDLDRGPAYAYRVVAASFEGNLLNIIDGVIENIKSRYSQLNHNVYEQTESSKDLYEESRTIWYAEKSKRKRAANKAFNQYVTDMENYIRGQIELEQLDALLKVIKQLKDQVIEKANGYYLKFSRVISNLAATFYENKMSLENNVLDHSYEGSFAMPLLTIQQIRPTLDAAVDNLNMSEVLKNFVSYMFKKNDDGKEVWIDEDENKISRAVIDFFVNGMFYSFASRTITEFLADKYQTNVPEIITNHLYNEYMVELVKRSEALFPVDTSIYGGYGNEVGYISVPTSSDVVIQAAQQLHYQHNTLDIKKSALKDRIYIMRCSVAVPIGAYANGELYEKRYYSQFQYERHYYTGKGGNELFNNWHDMLPLRPQSVINDREHLPEKMKNLLQNACDLYDKAKEAHLFQGNQILKISDESSAELKKAMADAEDAEKKAENMPPNAAAVVYKQVSEDIKKALENIQYEESGYSIPAVSSVADPVVEERIRKDYFVSCPVYHTIVKRELEVLQKCRDKAEELEQRGNEEDRETKELKEFCRALFTGAIVWKDFLVVYNKVEYGLSTAVPLTDFQNMEKFKYAEIPLYQAFLSYQALDADSKNAICADANKRYSSISSMPEVVASIKSSEERITENFVRGSIAIAGRFPEISESVKKFMGTLKQELDAIIIMARTFSKY